MDENDSPEAGETLSIDQAAAAYAKISTPDAADTGQADDEEQSEGEQAEDELQASDEDAGEEAEGETDEQGQATDEDEDEPETERGRYVAHNGRVKLPDGTESTVDDLIKGNLRDRDYRQKTMAHAEEVKTFRTQSEAVKQREQQLNQQAEYVAALVRSIVPEQPPMPDPALADPTSGKYDPAAFIAAQGKYNEWAAWQQHINQLDAQRQEADKTRSTETAAQKRERADAEWTALLEKAPEFKDQKRTEAFVQDVTKFGTETYGFTKDEIREAVGLDHRQALVLKDAIAWRKLQASKANLPKKIEGRPPVQKAGKRLSSGEQRARGATDALSRLKQTGSLADATAAYLATQNKG
jgi:hypothetical protein